MRQTSVLFKGTRDGLEIHIEEGSNIGQAKNDILKKLRDGGQFFGGTTINLIFTGQRLSSIERTELIEAISQEINVGNIEFRDRYKNKKETSDDSTIKEIDSGVFTGIDEGMTRFIRGTVRNGQRIFYEGNVVVIGDVNPGGEIIAGGNIIIFGTLRGLAHAGATGNREATIVCSMLKPTQIRIATLISRPPEDEDDMQPVYPEIVYIKDNMLVIEPVK